MDISRINELAKKARTKGLTEEEKKEQQELRSRYISNVRKSLKSQLNKVYIIDEVGNKKKLGKSDDNLP